MFDEPTAGMSVDEVPVILDLIRELKARRDKLILLVEHKMDVVRELADRIIVLHNGALVADGEPAAVIASPVVQQAYLGVAPEDEAGMSAAAASCRACTRTSARTTSCTASISRCRPGEVTMLLGRNGAGKTTTLRTIMGLWAASSGSVQFQGPARSAGRRTAAHARDRAGRHRLRAREHGHLLRPDGEGEHAAGRPRGAPRRASWTASGWSGSSACFRR